MAANTRIFSVNNERTITGVRDAIVSYVHDNLGFETQVLEHGNGEWVIRAGLHEDGFCTSLLGLKRAANVRLISLNNGQTVAVEISGGKWLDKAMGVAAGWWIASFTLVTTAYGAIQQCCLPNRIFRAVERYLGPECAADPSEEVVTETAPVC